VSIFACAAKWRLRGVQNATFKGTVVTTVAKKMRGSMASYAAATKKRPYNMPV